MRARTFQRAFTYYKKFTYEKKTDQAIITKTVKFKLQVSQSKNFTKKKNTKTVREKKNYKRVSMFSKIIKIFL